ncbi:DUF5677 domain-containing protein [Fundidesulfovibrio terrae]|uniref:DUF5677 domain-containing protein n=1 Tax=Fundidesulfovibrio terrae TaxID=2922866 RepID=UPI001FB0371A|nr:DUF5677 domain-containing protein [Fundidesulfovibrio terrae]
MNTHSQLRDHEFKKGKFFSPFNKALGEKGKLQSWFHERLPEYMWIAIILETYGRKDGFNKMFQILKTLVELNPAVRRPSWFSILKLPEDEQLKFYGKLETTIDKHILSPLTIVHQHHEFPVFVDFFCNNSQTPKERTDIITNTMLKAAHHQSDFATDIRYIALMHQVFSGSLKLPKEVVEELIKYPELEHTAEEMHTIRPMIRSSEMSLKMMESMNLQGDTDDTPDEIMCSFWDVLSRCVECELFIIKREVEKSNTDMYVAHLQEIFRYLSELFTATKPLDAKMLVLLGIATYAYKRMHEVYAHDLYNSVCGRGAVRSIIECYIMLKYLLLIENDHKNIWEEYQYYGIGLTKLVVSRSRDSSSDLSNSHVDYRYLELLVNHYMDEEFINMDTSYFDKKNIREKAIAVDEKELFGLYYDYDSHFEHGLWGAIRESALVSCKSPAHQFHCVPDALAAQSLPSVWHDCKFVMGKILAFLDEQYFIPNKLLSKVQNA